MSDEIANATPPSATGTTKSAAVPGPESEAKVFIDTPEFLRRIPWSPGTLANYRKAGHIPYVQLGRRICYHWPSVEAALLRAQRNAEAKGEV
jgi:hypothetical protein